MTLEVEKGGTGATSTNTKKTKHNPQIASQQEVVMNDEDDKAEEESKIFPTEK